MMKHDERQMLPLRRMGVMMTRRIVTGGIIKQEAVAKLMIVDITMMERHSQLTIILTIE
jgi:hypothetical protein